MEVSDSGSSKWYGDAQRTEMAIERQVRKAIRSEFKCTLSQWLNLRDRTDLRSAAIHLAAFNGNIPLIKLLLENGADLKVATPSGVNALHMAAQGNQPSSLNHLLYD